jgi:hypothetical protein
VSLKPRGWKSLPHRDDRIVARIACRARWDTINGGAEALALVARLPRLDRKLSLSSVVSEVYRLSSGKFHRELEAWECPECGQAYLGQTLAFECCSDRE